MGDKGWRVGSTVRLPETTEVRESGKMGGQGRVVARFGRALPWGRCARDTSTDRPGDKTPYHPRPSQTLQPKRFPSLRPGPWPAAAAAGSPGGPWAIGSPSAPPFCLPLISSILESTYYWCWMLKEKSLIASSQSHPSFILAKEMDLSCQTRLNVQ